MYSNINYKNIFAEAGYSHKEIEKKVSNCFNEIFYGENKFFYMTEDREMAYIEDTGNHDVRTEGMSYGMMMCVQTDHKKEFDFLWKFARTYMYIDYGRNTGYFAWSVACDGMKNADSPAPDGEEFLQWHSYLLHTGGVMAREFSAIQKRQKKLLYTCIHKEDNGIGRNMWDMDNYLIRFVPECDFTDPSYHLPHFYRLFALWGSKEDSSFWKKAAEASREYLQKACDSITGLSPEYSYLMGHHMKNRKYLEGMTGFIVMLTGLLLILHLIIYGLEWKMIIINCGAAVQLQNYSIFLIINIKKVLI